MNRHELERWRKRHNMKQSELAALIGRTERTVRRWESGATPIPHWLPRLLETLERNSE